VDQFKRWHLEWIGQYNMSGILIIAKNKRAGFDFELSTSFEAGMVLQGTEVKSLRGGKCSINEAYVAIDNDGECWVYNMSIPPYQFGTYDNHQETRKRKLLLNRKEIHELEKGIALKGQTIVPVKVYFKGSRVKLEVALGKGKKLHDKRDSMKEKDVNRKIQQQIWD
jgi:SsrA-binding protein